MEIGPKSNQEYLKKLKMIQRKMEMVKEDQKPSVIKYMVRRKSAEEIQTPLHDVDYNNQPKKKKTIFFKTFQKVTIDPNIKLDEVGEEKWAIMANNYKSLIEKSRQSLTKVSSDSIQPQTKEQPKQVFLTRRQSIEFRLREIATAPSNHSSVSPLKLTTTSTQQQPDPYARFKKYYQKIGIPSEDPIKLKLQKLMSTPIQPNKKKDRSQHSWNSNTNNNNNSNSISPIKFIKVKKHNIQYMKDIKNICNIACNYQSQVRQDERNQIQTTSEQVGYIQAEFNKFHNMLTTDLEKLDYIEQ